MLKQNLSLLLFIGLLIGCATRQPADADMAIENVHIISMVDEQVDSNRTVLIKDDKISKIVEPDAVQLPDSVKRVDGNNGYLMPGLAEMHAHIPSANGDSSYTQDVLFLYLANGITTIRGMLGDESHLTLREQAANNTIISPRIYTAGPGFTGNTINSPEQARQRVTDQQEAGYDLLKILPGLSAEEYQSMAEEANNIGIEFSGHVPASVGLMGALEAGQTTVDHLDKYTNALVADSADMHQMDDPGVIYFGMHLMPYINRGKMENVVQATLEAEAWNVPTQALLEHVLNTQAPEEMAKRREFDYMPEQQTKNWINAKRSITGNEIYTEKLANDYLQLRRDIVKALHDAGAGLLLGSDAPQIFNVPGFSAHDELRYLVEAGLSPYEALKTGTVNTAQYFGESEQRGTIEEGKVADLVLLKNNPLQDISNSETIQGVMYRGNWLSRGDIDQRLQTMASN